MEFLTLPLRRLAGTEQPHIRLGGLRLNLLIVAALFSGCVDSGPNPIAGDSAQAQALGRQDLEIVDCLLPGQIRQLGNTTYATQRRPTRTTASDCRLRGGEYVAFDRADLKTSLRVWLETAQGGDPAAQTYVGELYERGIANVPNYEAAALWYQKAADQNYSRALFDLGTLYEEGHGVPQDKLKALDLYRQSSGMTVDSVIFAAAAQKQQDDLRTELQQQIADGNQRLLTVQQQLGNAEQQLARPASVPPSEEALAHNRAEIATLKSRVQRLEAEKQRSTDQLESIPRLRMPVAAATAPTSDLAQSDPRAFAGLNFGRYYALVIGNQHYEQIENLLTPINDAERVAAVLKDKYGFSVQVLKDASDVTLLKALNDLHGILTPDDNLLVYYAGHGVRLNAAGNELGYWLPVNSERPPNDTFWIPNQQITAHLARLSAKRILVVADSCYAGLLSADPSFLFVSSKGVYSQDYLAFKLPKRSRLLIASGGDEPVLDAGGGGDSVFAHAFISELEANNGLLPAPQLFSRISKRVEEDAARRDFVEKPELKSIKDAGHEMGDFFFLPKSPVAAAAP